MREGLPSRRRHPPAIAYPDTTPALEYVMSPEEEELRFRDYWKMLLKHRRLIMVIFLAALGIGMFITTQTTPLYTASTTIRIEPQSTPVMGSGEMLSGGEGREDYFQTQLALLKGRALAARVIQSLGLERNPNFVVARHPVDQLKGWVIGNIQALFSRAVDFLRTTPPPRNNRPSTRERDYELGVHPGYISRYLSLLTVEAIPKTQLLKISFSTIDPALSQELANAHGTAFTRMNLETRFELTKEAREFLEKKLAEFKGKVAQSEEALNRFRKAYGVVSLEGTENIIVDRMVDLNKRLTEARAKRIEAESLTQIIKDKNFASLSQIIDNNMVVQLRARIEDLEGQQARMATFLKPDHPQLQNLTEQINQARQRMNVEIRKVVRTIESDYTAARAREAAIQAEAEQQQQAALNLKERAVQYTLLQSEFEGSRTVFATVLKRLNETSVSANSPLSNIQITEPAEEPLGPSSPRTGRDLLLASGLGLFLGVGLAFLLEYLNPAMRTPEEVWRAVAVPTLGAVPHWRSLRRWEPRYNRLPQSALHHYLADSSVEDDHALPHTLVASHHPFSLLSESYRTIRTGLLLMQTDQPLQVILLTSARAAEGKTSVTLNLAITLAQSGRQVVVVDADLRAGNCHSMLGLGNRYGLVGMLNDDLPLDVGLQRTAIDGLYLLPRGPLPRNPADLLGSDEMKKVLQNLRERFDFVLIDSPPAIAVSDAAVLAVQCDGVLLVLRAQKTSVEAARRVVERLETAGARILGTVLIGVDLRNPEFAEHRQYYASYYSRMYKGTKRPS
jgi:succinoglycan biosynthesis transport protein ExoP